MDDRDLLLLAVLGRLHRLTPAVLAMAAHLPPSERHRLAADWRRHLRARRALVRALLAEAGMEPAARRQLTRVLARRAVAPAARVPGVARHTMHRSGVPHRHAHPRARCGRVRRG